MFSRRDFLRTSTLLALAPTVPDFLARTARAAGPEKDGRVLVVVELDGGNDGINTVVPFADEGYARHRKSLRLAKERLVKVDDRVGLHPFLGEFGKLLEGGRLAIVQGVGYPNPSRSHFRSMAVWQSARLDAEEHTGLGWLGRGLDERRAEGGETAAQFIGSGPPPVALRGRTAAAATLERMDDLLIPAGADLRHTLPTDRPTDDLAAFVRRSMLDAYATADRLAGLARAGETRSPASGLGGRLRLVSRLLEAGLGTRVFYVRQSGYDTHSSQQATHGTLLAELGGALRLFLDELKNAGLAERVVVLAFSEFGRTVKENGSGGTDHGTAGPVFLAGTGVRPGLVGAAPSLTDLDPEHGDLRVGLDFRRVYAAVMGEWLGLASQNALGGTFESLPLFRA